MMGTNPFKIGEEMANKNELDRSWQPPYKMEKILIH